MFALEDAETHPKDVATSLKDHKRSLKALKPSAVGQLGAFTPPPQTASAVMATDGRVPTENYLSTPLQSPPQSNAREGKVGKWVCSSHQHRVASSEPNVRSKFENEHNYILKTKMGLLDNQRSFKKVLELD